MTALDQYRRLEAIGLWHETPEAQRREVLVSLGEATLMISSLTEDPLSHWSLPAVERLNPGHEPALFAPGPDAGERLELTDPDMVTAIEKLRSAIARGRPHPGRLRLITAFLIGLTALALTAAWLPGALTRQTVAMLPEASRVEIGRALLSEVAQLVGRPCTDPQGVRALDRLSRQSFGAEGPAIVIVPTSLPETLALPGGTFVARASLVEDYETPEVLAGYLLAEDVRRQAVDPMLALLDQAGLAATFKLLTTGDIPEAALHAHAAHLLGQPRPDVPHDALVARFAMADVSSTPYAYARDVSGETVLGLIEADPTRGTQPAPLLRDSDWVSLQEICSR